jgi:hypothetical protein
MPGAVRADDSRVVIRHIREGIDDPATFGVTPALPLLTSTIIATESLKGTGGVKESNLSKPNRLPGGRRETSLDGAGDTNVECLFCPELDEFFEDALCDTFAGVGFVSSATISADSGDNSITDASVGGTDFAGIVVGDYITMAGWAAPATGNNKRFLVTAKPTAIKLVLAAVAPYGAAITTRAVGDPVVINGGKLKSSAISAASGDNSINDASGLLFANIPLYAWITMTGWATAGNNVDAYVSAKSTDNKKLTLSFVVLTTEATGVAVTLGGVILRDGVKFMTRSFERQHTDFSSAPYQAYKGQYCNSMELDLTFEELIKAKFTYVGRGPEQPSSISIGTGAPVAGTPAVQLMDVSNNLTAFRTLSAGGSGTLDGNIKSLKITLANNGSLIKIAQTKYPDGVTMGTAALSGSLEGYLVDNAGRVLSAFNRTPDGYHFKMVDDLGKAYRITIWRLLYDDKGDTAKSQKTGSSMLPLNWKAEEDPTIGHWIQIVKFP